jgi:hypothetical protein
MANDDQKWRNDDADRDEYLTHFSEPAGSEKKDATRIERALDRAHEIRKFEIDLYWKRAAYFWAFSAAAFAGYFALQKEHDAYATDGLFLVSILGLIFSLAWYFVNRGSTSWQRNWEKHVDLLEDAVTGPLYKMTMDRHSYRFWKLNSGYPFSPSKINGILGVFVIAIWIVLGVRAFLLLCHRSVWDYIVGVIAIVFAICLGAFGQTSKDYEVRKIEYMIRRYKEKKQ